jgi:predicted XRE-type DNA-binding protein
MRKPKVVTFKSVWDALADAPEESANLRLRPALMQQIAGLLKDAGCTQAESTARCGVTQPRISDMLLGRIACFSLDAPVNIVAALGRRITVSLHDAA